jgi:uncharacterized damage-inducible protein DinB
MGHFAESVLPEFDQEMANTRKVLERVPEDKLDWRPHPKSQTIGWNANHLADLPRTINATLAGPSFDFAPVDGPRYQLPSLTSRREILELFDRNVAGARAALAAMPDEAVGEPWTLLQAGQPLFTMPKGAVVRFFALNHAIHHRAILCVYLRLNDVPVPGMYGPSGDE